MTTEERIRTIESDYVGPFGDDVIWLIAELRRAREALARIERGDWIICTPGPQAERGYHAEDCVISIADRGLGEP